MWVQFGLCGALNWFGKIEINVPIKTVLKIIIIIKYFYYYAGEESDPFSVSPDGLINLNWATVLLKNRPLVVGRFQELLRSVTRLAVCLKQCDGRYRLCCEMIRYSLSSSVKLWSRLCQDISLSAISAAVCLNSSKVQVHSLVDN